MIPRYGLDGLEIEFNVGEIFSARPGGLEAQSTSCAIGA